MKMLNLLAAFHNWVTDKEFVWWPFSFLKPATSVSITFRDTLTMTACFGGLTFAFFTIFALMNNAFSFNYFIMTILTCTFGFLLWFNLITRPLWNHRARKLSQKN